MTADGATPFLTFQFERDLSVARVSANLPVSDIVSGTNFPISVDITWTGFGDAQRTAGAVQLNSPGGTNFVHTFNGVVRMAEASGVISDGVNNFTPQPSTLAEIETVQDSQVTVTVLH